MTIRCFQLLQASIDECQDLKAGEVFDMALTSIPLFSTLEKAQAFAESICRDLNPELPKEEPALVWEKFPSQEWSTEFNKGEPDSITFVIAECCLDPELS